jgi:ABC-2 type transport system permease protein
MLAYSVMLSVTSYLVASNKALNFLEQREAVSLTVQVAVSISALLVLIASADAVTSERERGTLETLLLTPAPRWALIAGKGVAALSLWVGSYVVAIPYLFYLAQGTSVLAKALVTGFAIGFVLAVCLSGLGLMISAVSSSNRIALSISLFLLLAIFIPTQLPTSAQNGWFGDALLRVDPITAGLRYINQLVVQNHAPRDDIGWVVGPCVMAVVFATLAIRLGSRLRLRPGLR